MSNFLEINYKKCSWISSYYGLITEIINKKKYKTMIEVGIGYGYHGKEVLNNSIIEKIYLVDPHQPYDNNDGFQIDIINNYKKSPIESFDELHSEIENSYSSINKNRYEFIRELSTDAVRNFTTDSIDLIFIDGDHRYQAVLDDLNTWWPIVKQGGILIGDDYWMSDVKNAVHKFAENNNLSVKFVINTKNNYKLFYFEK